MVKQEEKRISKDRINQAEEECPAKASPKTSVDFPATVIRRKNRRGVRSNV